MRTRSTSCLLVASALALVACNQSVADSPDPVSDQGSHDGQGPTPTFDTPREYMVNNNRAWAADIDGDGDLDVIIPGYGDHDVSVLYNRGDGSFDLVDSVISVDVELVTDVNGDGLSDLIAPVWISYGELEVQLAHADHTFSGAISTINEAISFDTLFFAADVDGDGHPDVVTTESDKTEAFFLDGAGKVTSKSVLATSVMKPTPDLDGDNRAEFYTVAGGTLSVHSSKTKTPWSTSLGSYDASDVKFVDVDGDGVTDMFVAAFESGRAALHALTFKGKGDGTFVTGGDVLIAKSAAFDDLVDIDGDGKIDIGYHDPNLKTAELFATGDGAFGFGANSYTVPLPAKAVVIQFADFNGDGRADILELSEYLTYVIPQL